MLGGGGGGEVPSTSSVKLREQEARALPPIGPIISESTNQRLHSDPKQEVKVLKLLVALAE